MKKDKSPLLIQINWGDTELWISHEEWTFESRYRNWLEWGKQGKFEDWEYKKIRIDEWPEEEGR